MLNGTWRRRLRVVLLSLPLLGTGACVEIVQDAVLKGFFNAAIPLLVDHVEQQLDPGTSPEGDGGG